MFERIAANPGVLGGKPCIRNTRISVEHILELAASGACRGDILSAYPHLAEEDVTQALQYAAQALKNEVVIAIEAPSEAA